MGDSAPDRCCSLFIIGLFIITSLITAVLPANAPEWPSGVAILAGFICSLFLTNKNAAAVFSNRKW